MATQTQYYNLDKPSYDEVADIEIINANMDKIDQQMRNNADGVNFAKAISSDAYDNSKSYGVGDYCIYDNKLYRCITAIESAEAFNITKWEQTTVGKEVKQLNSNLDVIGKCKNLLNSTLQTTTQNGVTCTNNGDGTYTINGTATQNTNFTFFYNLEKYQHLKNRTVKLVGCPKDGSSTTYRLMLQLQKDPWSGAYDSGEGSIITINNDDNWQCWIRIYEGATVSNLTFKPMITTNLNATYDDFVPYTGDGETLTHDVAELKNDLIVLETTSTIDMTASRELDDITSSALTIPSGYKPIAMYGYNSDNNDNVSAMPLLIRSDGKVLFHAKNHSTSDQGIIHFVIRVTLKKLS